MRNTTILANKTNYYLRFNRSIGRKVPPFKNRKMNRYGYLIFILSLFFISFSTSFANETKSTLGSQTISIPKVKGISNETLHEIAPIINKSIAEGYYPGAIVLAGYQGQIIYRGIFGNKRVEPDLAPMAFDTIFDLASLTKVIATTPAIMQLIESGKLTLNDPVAKYWPEFASNGKEQITIYQLLTHTSGLPAILPMIKDEVNGTYHYNWQGKSAGLQQIIDLSISKNAATDYLYSDINFITLGHLVEIISGKSLDQYVQNNIFQKLNMEDTTFMPAKTLAERIAPTAIINKQLRWGMVHDPIAYAMGGVAGNAGLFSTATDLGIFAQYMIDALNRQGGNAHKSPIVLHPSMIATMTSSHVAATDDHSQGLGWRIEPSTQTNSSKPASTFSHPGYTGTYIWSDPQLQAWLIILTSRTHPKQKKKNQFIDDRRLVLELFLKAIQ